MGRINSTQIANRLSGSSASAEYSSDPDPSENALGGNTLFACLVVGLFVGGAAIGFAASGRSAGIRQAVWESVVGPPPFVSRVAAACNAGWLDEGDNREQIHCHMTRQVERLCDARERGALVATLYDYETAEARTRLHAAFNVMSHGNDVMAMGIAQARSEDPNLSAEQRSEQLKKTIDISKQLMAPMQQRQPNRIKYKVLVGDVKSLVESGYLAATDFNTRKPEIVSDALASVGQVGHASCK